MKTATSYNRAYLASVLRTFAQIPLWGTSDKLVTLSEIPEASEKNLENYGKLDGKKWLGLYQ